MFSKVKSFKINENDLRVMLECGYILCEAGRFNESEAIFRGAAECLPNSEVPLIGLSNVFLQSKNFKRARNLSQQVLERFPDSLYAKMNCAEAKFFYRQHRDAIDDFQKIIEENPQSTEARTAQFFLKVIEVVFKIPVYG